MRGVRQNNMQNVPSEKNITIAKEVVSRALFTVCKKNKLDFFSLDKSVQMALMDSFHEGLKFVQHILEK